MRSWFKKITKRDAKVATVIFSASLIVLLISIIKSFLGGASFDDVRPDLLLIFIIAIIDYSMIIIAFSKDDDQEEKESQEAKDVKAAEKALEKDRAELLAEKYEDVYPKE